MRDPIAHALAYPFQPPSYGFHLSSVRGQHARLRLLDIVSESGGPSATPLCMLWAYVEGLGEKAYEPRVPVIAAGSNASPARLHTKFVEAGIDADFPVVRAAVSDLVPVYSAHISKYGSIPGTLTHEAGARSMLAIAFLTKAELEVVNKSEAIGKNYALGLIAGLDIAMGRGRRLDRVLAYVSKRGAFTPAGAPVRISAFRTSGSALAAAGQRRILFHARRIVRADEPLDEFVRRQIEDEAERLRRTAILAEHTQPCALPGLHIIAGGLEGPPGKLPDW